jgi:hypothetical protein
LEAAVEVYNKMPKKVINSLDYMMVGTHRRVKFDDLIKLGLTQNHEKTNRKVREGHKGIEVSESSCISPSNIKSQIS